MDLSSVDIKDTLTDEKYFDYQHAAHCFLWAPWTGFVERKYATKAAVLVQLRFDGSLGFVGGLVDTKPNTHQDIIDGLHKECREEINLNLNKFKLNCENYLCTHKVEQHKLLTHFYSLKVTIEDIKEIEKDCLSAEDYGDEVFGLLRVPLYTMNDNIRGFPTFLNNMFVGNAKEQLLYALEKNKILTEDDINQALLLSQTATCIKKVE